MAREVQRYVTTANVLGGEWAGALPVTPAIATMPSLAGVWDEATSAHTVSGSYGALIKKLLTVAKFLGLK